MALSNIFNEPRREITESVVGIAVFGVFAAADYWFASWFSHMMRPQSEADDVICICAGMLLGVALGIIWLAILVATHALGDAICNAFERRGVYLRPRNRPVQRSPHQYR